MKYRSPIRSLIPLIENIARDHMCYSQVYEIIHVACDHMSAMARIEEINQNTHRTEKQDMSQSAVLIFTLTLPSTLQFEYVNHRGDSATRTVLPFDIHFGTTPYHANKPQFFMRALDIDREAERWFAMEAMQNVRRVTP